MTQSTMLRLFIAVDVPDHIKQLLAEEQHALELERPPVRWVAAPGIHLTLQFLGDVEASRCPSLLEGLEQAAVGLPSFQLGMNGVGAFPNLRRPRVVWVGLNGELELLATLQRRVTEATRALGFESEARAWNPHLTLGRVRMGADRTAVARLGALCEQRLFAPAETWDVSRVALIRSELLPAGARYTVLGEAPLRGEGITTGPA